MSTCNLTFSTKPLLFKFVDSYGTVVLRQSFGTDNSALKDTFLVRTNDCSDESGDDPPPKFIYLFHRRTFF